MGQKVHPVGFRVGITKPWLSKWYSRKKFLEYLHEDIALRLLIKQKLKYTGLSKVEIERIANKVKIRINTSRPGVVIGKKGAGIDVLKSELQKKSAGEVFLDIQEIKRPELDSQIVSDNVAMQLEKRMAFRRAMKKAVQTTMKFGALGIRVQVSGRLGGAEIARVEWYREGRVPLHTLRADIDYGFSEAHTTYGVIGVKVWIFRGELLSKI